MPNYHGASPTNSRSFQTGVLSKVQEIVLKKAKSVTAKTIARLKESLCDDPVLLSQVQDLARAELSQKDLLNESAFDKTPLLDSASTYSQESVNMMSNPREDLFQCDEITNHDGPLEDNGCRYNVQAKWRNGDVTWEPLKNMSPYLIAEYIVKNNLYELQEEHRSWNTIAVQKCISDIKKKKKKEHKTSTGWKINRYTGKKTKKITKASTKRKRK